MAAQRQLTNEEYIRKIETGSTAPKAPYEMFLRLAVMREIKAPEYDLRELSQRRQYKLEELKFVNKDSDSVIRRFKL